MRSSEQCCNDRLYRQPESGATKPQRGQDQAQAVPGTAYHHMQRIAQRLILPP